MKRNQTRKIFIRDLELGGNDTVYIQSMTNTKTKNIDETVGQILELEKNGCQIVRLAILDMQDAHAITEIKRKTNIPLVADIHFDYKLALKVIENGIDKIRLNPGNLDKREHVEMIVNACKEKKIPIRIGVNSGSLPNGKKATVKNMIKTAKMHISILEELEFYDIVLSLKASDVPLMIKVYEKASKVFEYPLHLGVTESGTAFSGSIKSALGIGILLNKGIGSTIRVSLTADPVLEIKAAKEILKDLNLVQGVPNLVSCPTCGRIQYDMIDIAKKVEEYLQTIKSNINVAIMGCPVNGPGEAKHADIGIAGGVKSAILFKRGIVIKKVSQEEIYSTLIHEINEYIKNER